MRDFIVLMAVAGVIVIAHIGLHGTSQQQEDTTIPVETETVSMTVRMVVRVGCGTVVPIGEVFQKAENDWLTEHPDMRITDSFTVIQRKQRCVERYLLVAPKAPMEKPEPPIQKKETKYEQQIQA